jgi:hypothetical protein
MARAEGIIYRLFVILLRCEALPWFGKSWFGKS